MQPQACSHPLGPQVKSRLSPEPCAERMQQLGLHSPQLLESAPAAASPADKAAALAGSKKRRLLPYGSSCWDAKRKTHLTEWAHNRSGWLMAVFNLHTTDIPCIMKFFYNIMKSHHASKVSMNIDTLQLHV